MASPFSVFRRNQKLLLAISTVMIMLLFVIGDPLMKYINPHRAGQNPVVVKTNLRSYHQLDLVMLMQSRKVLESFLQLLAGQFVQKGVMSGQISSRDITFYATSAYDSWRQELLHRVVPPDQLPASEENDQARLHAQEEAQAIQTMVLADRAESQGLMITDQAINDFLKTLTRNTITGDEFQAIVSKLHAETGGVTQAYLFDALRRELLASRYSNMFWMANNRSVLPASRWTYFQRLNRRATAEVLGVSAEQFVKDVPEPKDAELLAFFNAHNQTIQVPDSPEPGFKQPTKAAFQYFKAKYSDFLERAQKEVTAEEMQAYYEKNKDIRFREREKPAAEAGTDAATPAGEAGAGSDTPASTQPDVTKPDAGKTDAGKTDAGKTDGAGKPAAGVDKPAPPADADKKKSSGTRSSSPFRPVALAQKSADAPAAADSAAKPAPATEGGAAPAGQAASDAATAETKPDDQSADGADETAKPAKPEIKYEPFEKVEEEIRKTLAGEKANKMVDEIFERLKLKMRDYASARGRWEANREEDASIEAPEPLNLLELASAEGLEAHDTNLVSAVELSEQYDLGKSFTDVYDQRAVFGYRQVSFVDIGFNERLYKPEMTQDNEGDRYLSWKTKETPSAVPTLDEVRQEVVRAFKMIDARKRATAAAEQLAKEAREAKKPLSEVFAGRQGIEVVDTGAFTWMTMGAVAYDPGASQPRLSPVHGVESAGEDFMQAVFDSTPDQIRVVFNQPQMIAYVVQIKEFQPDRVDLEQQFVNEDFRKYSQLAFDSQWNLYLSWLRWLDSQAGLTWVNPESTPSRSTR